MDGQAHETPMPGGGHIAPKRRHLLGVSRIDDVPFDDGCVAIYGRMRADLERVGTPIGPCDLLIAATAMAFDHTLITANTRAFSRVAGLRLENWEVERAG